MSTFLFLSMLITNCGSLPPSSLHSVLGSAVLSSTYSSLIKCHMCLRALITLWITGLLYDCRISMDKISVPSHAQWISLAEFQLQNGYEKPALSLESKLENAAKRDRNESDPQVNSQESPSSLSWTAPLTFVTWSFHSKVVHSKKEDIHPFLDLSKNDRGKDLRNEREGWSWNSPGSAKL